MVTVRRVASPELSAVDREALRALFAATWPDGGFGDEDLAHALGGIHWIAETDGRVVGHAAVVARALEVAGTTLATGFLEAVATHPDWRRRGIASRLLEEADAHIRAVYEIGGLSTGVPEVYARAGWELWRGPAFVRARGGGAIRTPDEDGGIMVLRTPRTPAFRGDEPIVARWRAGDSW